MAKEYDLKKRTKAFALAVLSFFETLSSGVAIQVLGKQLIRSGTSVGANYRSACRAKSTADFISKMKTVEEEADESQYWLELIAESGFVSREKITSLHQEAGEIVAIIVSSIQTARQKH